MTREYGIDPPSSSAPFTVRRSTITNFAARSAAVKGAAQAKARVVKGSTGI